MATASSSGIRAACYKNSCTKADLVKLAAVTATAAKINAATDVATAGVAEASKGLILDANKVNDGVVVVLRTNHPVANITAGTAIAVPAVTGKQFVMRDAWLRAKGGSLSGPTTIELVVETTGTVMLSHVTADMTQDTWRGCGTGDGTNVTTGITAGGLVTAGKNVLLTDTGGTAAATATSIDVIVSGYFTTA